MRRLLRNPLRFLRSEKGSFSVETVMIVPILLFAYAGLFTFFDAFRTQNVNVRSSYTIADMVSRFNAGTDIDTDYIDGLNKVLAVLTRSPYPTILRVSVVKYNGALERNELVWSSVDGGSGEYIAPLTQDSLTSINDQIPMMSNGDWNIVVETWSGFVPIMDWGLDAFYMKNLVVTRARFTPQLCLATGSDRICPW